MKSNKPDIATRKEVELLVNQFYEQVVLDDVIGYVFTDVAQIDLTHHLPKMYDFWESVLLGNPNYKGNPMVKHFELNRKEPLTDEHFNRWISLWEETVRSLFEGYNANQAVERAKSIGGIMQHKIGRMSDR